MSPPLHVVVISHALVVPSNRARWERMAELDDGVSVTVIVPRLWRTARYGRPQTFRSEPEQRDNYSVVPLRTSAKRSFYWPPTLLLRGLRADVVQINAEPTEWPLLQAMVVTRALAPSALRLFYYYSNLFLPPRAPWNRAKFSIDFAVADAAMVGSLAAGEVLRKLGFRKDVIVQTELGADERVWRPGRRDRQQPFTIGFVGPLLPEKGIADLVQALESLTGSWRLVVCGDGPEQPLLSALRTRLERGQEVHLHGLVERHDLPDIVRGFDVLVLPSRSTPKWKEQFGLVLAEAMLSCVAVVGSNCGAIPEVIAETGVVVPEGDWKTLGNVLARLRDEPRRREELALAGRQRALDTWSATALATQTRDRYQDLRARRAGGRR